MVGSKPYATGSPKCRDFGMADSAKYPGLCKPYEAEQSTGNEYEELVYNSINRRQNPSTFYTYKSYNSEYESEKTLGPSSSRVNNAQTSFQNRNFNTNANNEANSYNLRQEPKAANQQQYGNQRSFQPNSQLQQNPNRYQTSPFQQAYTAHQQQQQQKRPVNKTNPFHTYRWDLLKLKNYL